MLDVPTCISVGTSLRQNTVRRIWLFHVVLFAENSYIYETYQDLWRICRAIALYCVLSSLNLGLIISYYLNYRCSCCRCLLVGRRNGNICSCFRQHMFNQKKHFENQQFKIHVFLDSQCQLRKCRYSEIHVLIEDKMVAFNRKRENNAAQMNNKITTGGNKDMRHGARKPLLQCSKLRPKKKIGD